MNVLCFASCTAVFATTAVRSTCISRVLRKPCTIPTNLWGHRHSTADLRPERKESLLSVCGETGFRPQGGFMKASVL